MICYFCNRAVSLACSCGRYVCREHARGTFCVECTTEHERAEASACQRRAVAEQQRQDQRAADEARDREEHWCDFCGRRISQTTTKCRKCTRRFCDLHGQTLTLKTTPNPHVERYCFERCKDHLFRPGLLGRHEKSTTLIDWIFRDLKSQADKHFGTGYLGMGG